MSVTYDTLTGDTQLIQYVTGAGNTNLYPDSNTIAIAGPIWCPRIYGKDLTAFEIASSGKVAITLNDIHALDFSRASYINSSNYKNTILSQSNYSMALSANSGDLQMVFDAYSNNINITAASNISVTAASGNMTLTTSNNTIVSTSNNFILESHSNINLNAAKGAATISANNSNMFITMEDTNNTLTAYASNEIYISACNNFNVNTKSNINIGTLGGDFKTYADSSNMYLTMEKTTNNVNLFTLSNMYLTASNSVSVTAASNILLGALGGDFKAYAHNSNMYLSMEDDLDKITLYTASNMFVSASNNYNLNAKSNINIGALGGDIQMYSQSSNMFMIMQAATNNINSFASNNMNVSVSNNQNIWVKNNISASTVAGDYRLYVNSSNMFMRMSATTNNINIFSSNNTIFSASNNFNLYALSNFTTSTLNGSIGLSANSSNMLLTMDSAVNTISLFASNNMFIGASNNYNLSAQSNINQGALAGDFNTYADLSNMYLTMTRATDTITMYTSSNMFVSASNNYNLNVKSNILIGGLGGDVKLYSQKSNMFITMSAATNNMAIFASNNLSISVSNSINTWVNSNLTFSTKSGDVQIYANSSNMYLTMDHLTNNTSLFTSNNLLVSVSNSYNTQVNSNLTFSTKSGDVQIYANSSNMYLTMDHLSNNTSLFTSNNLLVSVSNNLNISANSNINVSTTYGSYNLAVNNSNMLLTMDYLTNNTSLFTSNNYQIGVCNNMNVNVKSNLNIGVLVGDINMYANGSNMFLTLNHLNNNMTSFTSNDMNVGASNNYNLNVNSNINIVSRNGDFNVYTNSSNMYLTMNHLTNNVSLFSSNDTTVSVSNNLNIFVQSNIAASANNGSILLYANSSNMFMTMDFTSNNVAVFASNNIYHTACNSYTVIARSNVSVSGNLGSIQLYSASSNMSLVMDAASRNTSIYTSNNMNVSISNNYNVNVQSNINIGTVGGDLKTYADSSNMYLTMEKTTNNVNLFTLSNMYLTASNSVSVTAASNIVLGALGGDFKAYAHNSNMYLTMEDNLDEITLYTASNMFVSASNNYNLNAQSNILMSALGGDVKIYSDKSNMSLTMDHLTDTETLYTLNQMNLTASNSFALNVQSNIVMNAIVNNITMFASNNVVVTASNSYTLNTQSNILLGALDGDVKIYSDKSNMFLTMDHATDNISIFSSNNTSVSVSNTLNIYVQSNITVSANKGDVLFYANSSNMYLTMNHLNNNTSLYASNNMLVTTSNSYTLATYSNVSVSGNLGSIQLYSASSNMSLVMDAASRNTSIYTSNNMNVSISNNYNVNVQSNINIGTVGGDLKTYADSSNMYLTMEKTTNNVNLFTLSNMYLTASNSVSVTTASNILLGALGGDFKAYAHNSNMYLTMGDNLDEITLYTASNMFVSASNNYNLNAQSNILMSALGGDVKIYSDKSNMFMTMDHLTDTQTIYTSNQMNLTASNSFALNVQSNIVMNAIVNNITMFASNNVAVTASNSYTLNSRSNISMTALNGDFTVSANSSNMFLSMDHLNKNTTLFSSNNINIGASNKLTVNAQSNMTINANYGEMLVYANSNLKFNADKSNMYMNFNMPSDIIDIYSLSNINVGASNNMFLSASSNISIAASNISMLSYADLFIIASNNITIAASNTLTMSFGSLNTLTSNDQAFTAQSNVKFYINSSSNTSVDPIFTISGNQVLVRGDMVITGDITTSNVFSTTVIQESLKVTDKTIRLANTGSNFNPADGQFDSAMVNGGAGITIDGVPSYWDSNIVNAYDKSLTWNYGSATGTGINQLGTSVGMSNEPFWDMKGGAFQLTHQKIVASGGSNIIQDISFRWRVNELDELEFVKTWWYAASNAYVSRRICRFGRIL